MTLECSILRKSCSFIGHPSTIRATLCFPEMFEGLPLSDLKEQEKLAAEYEPKKNLCSALL